MNTDAILNKLKNLNSESLTPEKSSAVIIPLLEISGELHILFEQRSGKLSFQPNEVCFPGGRIEEGEAPWQAGIRELSEELLIPLESITGSDNRTYSGNKHCPCTDSPNSKLIASLPPLPGPTGALVYPFVAILSGYKMTYSSDEVEKVFSYPISFFKEHPPVRYEMQRQTVAPDNFPYKKVTGGRNTYNWHRQHYDIWIYEDTSPVIWGFTGRLLNSFIRIIENIS